MADETPLPFERDLTALRARVAATGVDEEAVKQANTIDDRFVALLGLTPFEHGILALIGQALGQAGVAPEALTTLEQGGLPGHLLAAFMRNTEHARTWVQRYIAFQAGWWRP